MTADKSAILVAGYYGFQNLGDEMILAALVDGLNRMASDLTVRVVSGDPVDTHRRHGVEAILWTNLEGISRAIGESRLVILGGGGLFHDRHNFTLEPSHLLTSNHAGLTYYTDICLLAHLLGVPYVLAGVGVGPLQSQAAREMTSWCFQHAAVASVRDQDSIEQLVDQAGLSEIDLKRVNVTADLAFANQALAAQPRGIRRSENLRRLVVIPRHWAVDTDGWEWEDELAKTLGQVEADEIVFLTFQVLDANEDVDDRAVCRRIMAHPSLSGRTLRLEAGLLSERWVGELLSSCSAVLAMRYHGVLAGLQAGRPVLGMAYDPKVSALMDQAGLGNWVLSPAGWRQPELQAKLERLLSERVAISQRRLDELRATSEITLDRIWDALQSPQAADSPKNFFVQALSMARSEIEALQSDRAELENRQAALIEDLNLLKIQSEQRQARLEAEVDKLNSYSDRQRREAASLADELNQIHSSRYWRMMGWYWRLRHDGGRLWRMMKRYFRRFIRHPIAWIGGRGTGFGAATGRPPVWEKWGLPHASPGMVDIIVFPIIDWDFRFQRPQQLARGLAAAGHRVFYLSTSFNPGGLSKQVIEPNIYQIQLPGPGDASIYTDLPTEAGLRKQMRAMAAVAHAAGVAEAVCLVQLPFWGPLAGELGRLNGWKVVYDCLDDHAGFSTNTSEMVALEDGLLNSADLVLATSERLYRRCQAANANTQRLPNAADLAHFSRAKDELPPPSDFPAVDRPIIGYIGAISDWFDFDLLRDAVENIPDAFFYLIGDTWGSQAHEDLASHPNVHFAGEKSYQSLPAYLAQFDVCLIPFKDTPLTQATDPVKVYEYLAAGKPVVARKLPELKKFGQAIHLADSPQAFTQAIREALSATDPEHSEFRGRLVTGHDWSNRVDQLRDWLEGLFEPVSLVIPVWNQLKQTRQCLTSLLETTRNPNLEVIVVDNGSDTKTANYLESLARSDARVKIIPLEDNKGFGPAVNIGFRQAKGQVLGILNNDIILTRGWLSKLLAHLKRDSSIGMIGPVTNAVGNEALLTYDFRDRIRLEEFSSQVAFEFAGRSAPIPMLAMYCVLLPRSVYHQVGELDERFSVGMFEDDDYAIRLRLAGYRPAVARDVFIHHHGQATFDQLGGQHFRTVFHKNQAEFESKWEIGWQGHTHYGLDVYEEAAKRVAGCLVSNNEPVIILPVELAKGVEEWKALLDAPQYKDKPIAYWGENGLVEFSSRLGRLHRLPWVAMDLIAAPLLFGRESSPTKEIWTRLRSARYLYPQCDHL